jgi:dipeptidyl aminopeptidase/acylaminoacyl peptidase
VSHERSRQLFVYTPLICVLAAASIIIGTIGCRDFAQHNTKPSSLAVSGIPKVPDSLLKKLTRYQDWHSSVLVDWTPDAKGVVAIRRAQETGQLYFIDGRTHALRQLTNQKESVLNATVCPNTMFVLFCQDSGGNENFQIYACSLTSGAIFRLTNDNAQNDGMVWSNRGDRFMYSSNRRNGKDFDLYVRTIAEHGSDTMILSRGGTWSALDWSSDDCSILISQYVSRTVCRLFILDMLSRAISPLNDTIDTVSEELGMWDAIGTGIFYTSDKETDVRCLHHRNISSGRECLLTDSIPWDVREFCLSSDRSRLAFATNENGFSQVYLMNARSEVYKKIPHLPHGIISHLRFNPSGEILAMTVTTPDQPEDIYSIDLTAYDTIRWTHNGFQPKAFLDPVVIYYPTFDSVNGTPRTIPCIVYKPKNKKSPFPVLLSIHGGPESQFWPSFKPDITFYVEELGFAILAPNVRGSGGYGKTWLTLDNGYKREDAVKDIGALLDWIIHQPDLDSSRVAVMGGSYGGYMSLASIIKYGNRLVAGIDQYGISNFVTFLENTAAYRRDARRVEYGDERDTSMRRFLLDISPLTHADRINKPLLIIQGANDARVPLSESRQIVEAVRKDRGEVWFLVAGDEGHGYRKKSNRDYQDAVTALFLERYGMNAGTGILH